MAEADAASEAEADEKSRHAASGLSPRLFRGLRVVGGLTLLSRILGLVRDAGMAGLFGLGPIMDAFTVAFRIPNLARRLFGEGALSVAFLPVLARELAEADRSGAWRLCSAVFTLLTLFLTALVLIAEVALWLLWRNSHGASETALLLELTGWMLPYLVLICLASQVGGVLNSLGHFAWPAFVPVLLNACWIAGLWLIAPHFESPADQARVLAACIVAAGVLQLVVQWPTLWRLGYRPRGDWAPVRHRVSEILRGMLPVVAALSITQINTLADSLIAWFFSQPLTGSADLRMPLPGHPPYPLQSGAVSALYYGERLYQFPLGVFGIALGTVLFPLLARHAARGELERLRHDLSLALRLIVAIGIPASAGLIVLAHPLARALFLHGAFLEQDALRTAHVIAVYGSGVWAYCGVLILQRAFYAQGQRDVPIRVGMATVGLNLIGNLVLIWPLGELGLALSTALAAAVQTAALIWCLQVRLGRLDWPHLGRTLWRVSAATGLMSAAGLAAIAAGSRFPFLGGRLAGLVIPGAVSVAVWLAAARVLGIQEFWMLLRRERPAEE